MTHAVRVAFQGASGAFSEAAILAYFGERPVTSMPFTTFAEVGDAVRSGIAELGVLPVENSTAGRVLAATDVLARGDLEIVDEVVQRIRLCLLGIAGSRADAMRRILSHPVALAQCTRFLRQLGNAEAVGFYDTAGAAAEVARQQDPTLGALASAVAARHYRLTVLAQDVHDDPENRTRFVVVRVPGAGS